MHKRLFLLFLIILSASTISFIAFAQDDDVETPTPAPSKTITPTSEPTEIPPTPTATQGLLPTPTASDIQQFTQNDLNILVGNVQRPNGMVWYNEKLYVACSGDFTLYEIDSITGNTTTFSSGIRDANVIWTEETDSGFNIWMLDFDTNQLVRGNQLRGLPAVVVDDNLDGPWGFAYVDSEYFLITNALSNNVVLANRDGTSNIVMEGLRYPTGIVVDGEVGYVANRGSARRAIEWFNIADIDPESSSEELTQPLVSGLQNVSNLLLAQDGYLYFTYALAERGVVGRVNPHECRDGGCTNEQVEIVILTDGRTAPLAGLTISDDMRLFVHTVYDSEIFWVRLYD